MSKFHSRRGTQLMAAFLNFQSPSARSARVQSTLQNKPFYGSRAQNSTKVLQPQVTGCLAVAPSVSWSFHPLAAICGASFRRAGGTVLLVRFITDCKNHEHLYHLLLVLKADIVSMVQGMSMVTVCDCLAVHKCIEQSHLLATS